MALKEGSSHLWFKSDFFCLLKIFTLKIKSTEGDSISNNNLYTTCLYSHLTGLTNEKISNIIIIYILLTAVGPLKHWECNSKNLWIYVLFPMQNNICVQVGLCSELNRFEQTLAFISQINWLRKCWLVNNIVAVQLLFLLLSLLSCIVSKTSL